MSVYEPSGPPRVQWRMWKRFLLAMVIVTSLTSASVATALLLELETSIDVFGDESQPLPGIEDVLEDVDPGKPQTILVLGSDKRFADEEDMANSDTMILVRLDPEKGSTAVMSIPRDLLVEIPGHGRQKINAAYSLGGPRLTVRTVRELMDTPIHHVVNVNFGGFRRAVDRLGCVYADIDRRYFNDNNPPVASNENYAVIDIDAGYQKLCGQDALDYVRFRHLDDDFVRAARQQNFLSQAKEQIGVGEIFGDRRELLRIFGRYTQTDIADDNTPAILRLLKLTYESSQTPIRSIRFRGEQNDENTYVTISDERLQRTREEFLNVQASSGPRTQQGDARERQGERQRSRRRERSGLARGLVNAETEAENHVLETATRLDFPVYYPRARLARGQYLADDSSPRRYDIFDRGGRKHRAYRIVVSQGDTGQYYGIQGMSWRAPPILDNPDEQRRMAGRTYELFYDGDRLRMVAWRTARAVYWVSNTLSKSLTNGQMLDIARSLQRPGE